MKTTTGMRLSAKLAMALPLALIGLAAAPHARADTIAPGSILLAQTTLVVGQESTVDSFTTPGAGTISVSLENLNWLSPLSALSFSATTATDTLWSTSGSSSMVNADGQFTVGSAGTYFAHIMAKASNTGPWAGYGAYSLMLLFTPGTSPVPLPASGWMLLTGMLVLAGLARTVRPFELMGTAKA
jgi:hypothetical protein